MSTSGQMSTSRQLFELDFVNFIEINFVNLVDPQIAELERNLRAAPNQTVLTYGGMCNGVSQMVSDIKGTAKPGRLKVLRIWSHGFPGGQAVSVAPGVDPAGQRAGFSMGNYSVVQPYLAQIEPCFARGGRAELRACEFSAGDDGIVLLTKLAKLWQVDVYAALNSQSIGPIDWCGPVTRMTPQGKSYPTSGIPVGR